MSGQRIDPYKNYNFLVEIAGVTTAGFSSCVIPDSSVEVIEYREGSDNVAGVRKLPGRVKYSNLVLKRGLTNSLDLWNWYKSAATGLATRTQVMVTLLDDTRTPVMKWVFSNAWPTKYEGSPLQGKGNEVAIETLEIAHEGMDLSST
jgi:phage tail-like protein